MEEALRRIELDLMWYAEARMLLDTLGDQLDDLLMPTCAKGSHIGATTGRPGNPTATRAFRREELRRKIGPARRVVSWVDAWLPSLRDDDRLLIVVRYGLRDGEAALLQHAAWAAGIPCDDDAETLAVAEHIRALIADALAFTRRRAA